MGNRVSTREANGRVVLPDGTVHKFDESVTVAELMLDHPQQVVVEFGLHNAGKKLTPLPADKKLDVKKVYLMIPKRTGRTGVLSVDEARRVLENANAVLRSRAVLGSGKILPLLVRGCKMGVGIRSNAVMHGKDEEVETRSKVELLPEPFDEQTEFLSRQFSGKGWKPSLDTIKEKKIERKVSHWLF